MITSCHILSHRIVSHPIIAYQTIISYSLHILREYMHENMYAVLLANVHVHLHVPVCVCMQVRTTPRLAAIASRPQLLWPQHPLPSNRAPLTFNHPRSRLSHK